jgi:hypothetical protein
MECALLRARADFPLLAAECGQMTQGPPTWCFESTAGGIGLELEAAGVESVSPLRTGSDTASIFALAAADVPVGGPLVVGPGPPLADGDTVSAFGVTAAAAPALRVRWSRQEEPQASGGPLLALCRRPATP